MEKSKFLVQQNYLLLECIKIYLRACIDRQSIRILAAIVLYRVDSLPLEHNRGDIVFRKVGKKGERDRP